MKLFFIQLIFLFIIKNIVGQTFENFLLTDECKIDDYKCEKCFDYDPTICQKCYEDYSPNWKCKASCYNDLYYNPQKKQCVAVCDSNQIENDVNSDCVNIQTCPTVQNQFILFHTEKVKGVKEIAGQYFISYDNTNKIFISSLTDNTSSIKIENSIQENILGIEEIQYQSQSVLVWTENSYAIISIKEKKVIFFNYLLQYARFSKEITLQVNTLNSLTAIILNISGQILAYDLINSTVLSTIQVENYGTITTMRFFEQNKQKLAAQTNQGYIIEVDISKQTYKSIGTIGNILAMNSNNDSFILYFSTLQLITYDINQSQQTSVSFPPTVSQIIYLNIFSEYKLILSMNKSRDLYLLEYNLDSNKQITQIKLIQSILCQNTKESYQCDETVVLYLSQNYILLGSASYTVNSQGQSIANLYRINFQLKSIEKVKTLINPKSSYYLGLNYYYIFTKKIEYIPLSQYKDNQQFDNSKLQLSKFKSNFSFTNQLIDKEIINVYYSSLYSIFQDTQNIFYFFDPIKLNLVFTARLSFQYIYIKDNDLVCINKAGTYFFKINKQQIFNIYISDTSKLQYCDKIYFYKDYIFQKCENLVIRYDRNDLNKQIKLNYNLDVIIIQNDLIFSLSELFSYASVYRINFQIVNQSKPIYSTSKKTYPSATQSGFLHISNSQWTLSDQDMSSFKQITNQKLLKDNSKYQFYLYHDKLDFILTGYDQTIIFYRISTDVIERTISNNLISGSVLNMQFNQQNQFVILFNNTSFESLAFIDLKQMGLLCIFPISSTKSKTYFSFFIDIHMILAFNIIQTRTIYQNYFYFIKQSQKLIFDTYRDSLYFYSTLTLNKFDMELNAFIVPQNQINANQINKYCKNKIFIQYDITFITCFSTQIQLGVFTYSTLSLIRNKTFQCYSENCQVEYIPEYLSIIVLSGTLIFKYNYDTNTQTDIFSDIISLSWYSFSLKYNSLVYSKVNTITIKDLTDSKNKCQVQYSGENATYMADYFMIDDFFYGIGTFQQGSQDYHIFAISLSKCKLSNQFILNMKNPKFITQFNNKQYGYIVADMLLIVYNFIDMKISLQQSSNSLSIFFDNKFIYLMNSQLLQTNIQIFNPKNNTIQNEVQINSIKPVYIYYFSNLNALFCILQTQIYVLDITGKLLQYINVPINISNVQDDQSHGVLFLYSSLNQIAVFDYLAFKLIDIIQLPVNLQVQNIDFDGISNILQINDSMNITLIDMSVSIIEKQPYLYQKFLTVVQNKKNQSSDWIYIFDYENQIWRYSSIQNNIELVYVDNLLTNQRVINEEGNLILSTLNSAMCFDGLKLIDQKLTVDNLANSTDLLNSFSYTFKNRLYITSNNNRKVDEIICSQSGLQFINIVTVIDFKIQHFILFSDGSVIIIDENGYLRKNIDNNWKQFTQIKNILSSKIIQDKFFILELNDQIQLFNKDLTLIGQIKIQQTNQIYIKIPQYLLVVQNQIKKLYSYYYDDKQITKIQEIYLPCQQNNLIDEAFSYILIYCCVQINIYSKNKDQQLSYVQTLYLTHTSQIMMFGDQYLMINLKDSIHIYKNKENDKFFFFKSIQIFNIFVISINLKQNRNLEEFEFVLIQEQQVKTFTLVTNTTLISYVNNQCYNDIYDVSDSSINTQLKNFLENRDLIGSQYYKNVVFNIFESPTKISKQFIKQLFDLNFKVRFIGKPDFSLIIESDVFHIYKFPNLTISNAIIQFNQYISGYDTLLEISNNKYITLENIKIDYRKNIIAFFGLQRVQINNMSILGQKFDGSGLMYFHAVSSVLIRNLHFEQNNILNHNCLFYLLNCTFVNIQQLNVTDNQDTQFNNLFEITRTLILQINNVEIIRSDNNQSITTFFQLNAVVQTYINNITILNVKNIQFINSDSSYQSSVSLIKNTGDYLLIDGLNVEYVQLNNVTSFLNVSQSEFKLQYSNFRNIINMNQGMIISTQGNSLSIYKSTFNNCKSQYGVLYGIKLQEGSEINSSIFNDCESYETGGAINLISSKVLFLNNSIYNNQAKIGGGIYYDVFQPSFLQKDESISYLISDEQKLRLMNENQTQVYLNKATFYGQNIGSQLSKIELENHSKQGESNFLKIDDHTFLLDKFRSGDTIYFNVILKDEEGNQLKLNQTSIQNSSQRVQDLISQLNIYIQPQNDEKIQISSQLLLTLEGNNNSQENQLISQEIKIIGNPLQSSVLVISSNKMKESNRDEKTEKDCYIGEVFEKRDSVMFCKPCANGFYSLLEPQNNIENKCTACPDSAYKCERDQIYLKEGYWRRNNLSDNIFLCYNKRSNCQGSNEGNRFYCSEGYIGALCETCDYLGNVWGEKYMRENNFGCKKCSQVGEYLYLLPLFGVIIFILAYIIFSVNVAIKLSKGFIIASYFRKTGLMSMGTSSMKDLSPFYVKQLMHYQQIVSIVNVFSFDLPDILTFIPDIISIPIQKIEYSFDCVLNDIDWGIPITFLRAFWSLLIPFIFLISVSIVYLIMILVKTIKHNKSYVYNGLFFMLIFLQAGVVSSLVAIISCRKIDGIFYIRNDTSFECYTPKHTKFSLLIVFPGLLFWLVIIPLLILRQLNQQKNRLETLAVRFKFGFLYQEFKEKYFYWEFIKSYKKMIIVVIYNVFLDKLYIRLVLIGFILLIYNQLIHKFQPYKNIMFNQLDLRIINTIFAILLFNILLHDNSALSSTLHQFLVTFTALIYYFVFLILICLVIYSKVITKCITLLLKIQNFINTKCPLTCIKINFKKPINCARANKNWRKIQYFSSELSESKKHGQWIDPLQSLILNKTLSTKLDKAKATSQTIDVGATVLSKFSSQNLSKHIQNKLKSTSIECFMESDDRIHLQPYKKNTITKQIREEQGRTQYPSSTTLSRFRVIKPEKILDEDIINQGEEQKNGSQSFIQTNVKKNKLNLKSKPISKNIEQIKKQSSKKPRISIQLDSNSSESSLSEENTSNNDNRNKSNKCKGDLSENQNQIKYEMIQLQNKYNNDYLSSTNLKQGELHDCSIQHNIYSPKLLSQVNISSIQQQISQVDITKAVDQFNNSINHLQPREIFRDSKEQFSQYNLNESEQNNIKSHQNNSQDFINSPQCIGSGTTLFFQKMGFSQLKRNSSETKSEYSQFQKYSIQNDSSSEKVKGISLKGQQKRKSSSNTDQDSDYFQNNQSNILDKYQSNQNIQTPKLVSPKGLVNFSDDSNEENTDNEKQYDTIRENIN